MGRIHSKQNSELCLCRGRLWCFPRQVARAEQTYTPVKNAKKAMVKSLLLCARMRSMDGPHQHLVRLWYSCVPSKAGVGGDATSTPSETPLTPSIIVTPFTASGITKPHKHQFSYYMGSCTYYVTACTRYNICHSSSSSRTSAVTIRAYTKRFPTTNKNMPACANLSRAPAQL